MRVTEYGLEVERTAAKSLAKIARPHQQRIAAAVRALATDPRPAGCVKLTGVDAYRVRVGTYRVVYVVDDATAVVTVTRIGHRGQIYEGM